MINLSVKIIPETTIKKFTSAISRLFWLAFASALLAGALILATPYLESRWEWLLEWRWLLENVTRSLIMFVLFIIFPVNLIIPGLLFIFLYPELGHAWLRTTHPVIFSSAPWEQMSDGAKFWSFLQAMIGFAAGIFILYEFIINGWLW